MKKFGFGIALLAALLVCALATWWGMEWLHRPVVQELNRAVALAEEGNGAAAKESAKCAKEKWRRNWHFAAAFADHTPMEEIDSLFAELDAYEPMTENFKACCRKLALRTEAMAHAHVLSWWNLL